MQHLTVTQEELNQAAELIISYKMASVSLLQRRLDIGYSKAAEMMEGLEQAEIVGPFEGKKIRSLLVTSLKDAKVLIKNLLIK